VAPNSRLVTDDWPYYNDISDIKHKAITLGKPANRRGSQRRSPAGIRDRASARLLTSVEFLGPPLATDHR
jgi:hypothetical protein